MYLQIPALRHTVNFLFEVSKSCVVPIKALAVFRLAAVTAIRVEKLFSHLIHLIVIQLESNIRFTIIVKSFHSHPQVTILLTN